MSADRFQQTPNANDSRSWNKYAYATGDPVNQRDPHGQFGCTCDYPDPIDGEPGGPAGGPQKGNPGNQGNDPLPDPLDRWNSLEPDCQQGLIAAISTGAANAAKIRLQVLDRALASASTIQKAAGDTVDWTWIAAIGIRESLFQNIAQSDANGMGIFQIDLGQNPGVTAAQAQDTAFAASWVAQYLLGASSTIAARFPKLSSTILDTAVLASYNHGIAGEIANLSNGQSPDYGATRQNYGSNVLNLTKCFE